MLEVPKVTSRISDTIGKRITITFYQLAKGMEDVKPKNLHNLSSPTQITGKTPSFGGIKLQSSNMMLGKNPMLN